MWSICNAGKAQGCTCTNNDVGAASLAVITETQWTATEVSGLRHPLWGWHSHYHNHNLPSGFSSLSQLVMCFVSS